MIHMIRQLHLSDLPRQMFPGRLSGYDLACVWETLGAPVHRLTMLEMARYGAMSGSSRSYPLAMVDGLHVKALAVVRPRRGDRSWELSHLYISPSVEETLYGDLLNQSSAHAAQRGAERLFLRVAEESPLQEVARRSGFFPGFTEEVYRRQQVNAGDTAVPHLSLRPPYETDQHNLFRLYNACVPASVRSAFGLTREQWSDSQETMTGKTLDYVWERYDELRCWLRIVQLQDEPRLEAMLHPNESAALFLVCEAALRLVAGDRAMWVVPSYQPALASALRRTGWTATHRYAVLVKPLAKGVEELSTSLVRA